MSESEENEKEVTEPSAQPEVEPNKRLEDAEPEELAQALKQVFSGEEKVESKTYDPERKKKTLELDRHDQDYDDAHKAHPQAEAKSGYTNPFALFADIFYGVLIAPRQTLRILSDSSKFPPTPGNLFLTFLLVSGALLLPASIKIGSAANSTEGIFKGLAFIFGNMFNWVMLAAVLYYLSIWLRGNRLSPGNAFIATGWAYLPFAFFAPVACFKSALGGGFMALACIPALWFIALQWLAFQTSLRTSTIKLAMIALVVPPVFCLVYLFWIGLAVCSLLGQLISHIS